MHALKVVKAMNNKAKEKALVAARAWPRPGDFPAGSMESRAAARRMMLDKRAPQAFIIYDDEPVPSEMGERDILARIVRVGYRKDCRDATDTDGKQELTGPSEAEESMASPSKESQQPRTDRSQYASNKETSAPDLEDALEAAREARVIEYGKYIARRERERRRGYRRLST
jgi:hypothetical protein